MKNSIKIPALLLALSAFSLGAKAQTSSGTAITSNGVIYSIGVESGVSTGNFNSAHKWNIGGSVQADIPLANKLDLTVNAGYLNFNGKNNISGTGISATDIHLLPAMAGLKYFPINHFYIQGDAGAGFALNKSDAGFTKAAAFLYTPQIGVQIPLSRSNFIDASVRYEGTGKFSSDNENSKIDFFGLRVAYAFGL